jgi:hypothetical protein
MPQDADRHKLRLKLPSGAEFEAEGAPGFISGELREFLALQAQNPQPAASRPHPRPLEPNWADVLEAHGQNIQLRSKLRGGAGEREACLVLLAGANRVLRVAKPTAAQIARWLRASGYPIRRVDRAIQDAIETGDILASGSRRGRRYELSSPGLAKAFNLALQQVEPRPASAGK